MPFRLLSFVASPHQRALCVLLLAASTLLGASGCNAFRRTGPDEVEPVEHPLTTSVTIEYEQIVECVPGSPRCEDNVVFFGSWMTPGQEFFLRKEPGRYVWRGRAERVPVNFPPRGQPHFVRVYDPHIVGGPTQGITADRLKVGGELMTRFHSPGNPFESGLVYIDQNGLGRSPF